MSRVFMEKIGTMKNGILAFAFIVMVATGADAATIKIGVVDGASSGTLVGQGIVLRDGSGKRYAVGTGARVVASGRSASINGMALPMPVTIVANNDSIGWDKIRYRGSLVLSPSSKGITVINELDMESYMRGILKIEMNPEWAQEALKAQAILARTFAVKNMGRHRAQGYDLCDQSHCQNYRGINGEDPRSDAAVVATAGKLLTWNGQVANVYYHSDSGGSTADVSTLWGGAVPYLVPRTEPTTYVSPYSTWSVGLSASQLSAALAKANIRVGTVRSVQIAARDSSGRVSAVNIAGSAGSAQVKGHVFRAAVGYNVIRSTNFEIGGGLPPSTVAAVAQPVAPVAIPKQEPTPAPIAASVSQGGDIPSNVDPLVHLTKLNVFTSKEIMDMLMNPDKREEYIKIGIGRITGQPSAVGSAPAPAPVPVPTPAPAPVPAPTPQTTPANVKIATGDFVFSGRGWGHGVGLSQWGAKALADQGWTADQILSHYFPGTKVN